VSVRHIEDRPVVTAVWGAAVSAGLAVGDVIVRVDGRPASERLDLLARHLAASTPQSRHRDAADRLLRGASGSTAKVVVERADGVLHEVSLLRDAFAGTPAPAARTPVDRLAGDIGYLDLRQLQNHQVDDAFDALHDTRALIFDMRGYPHGTALRLVSHLTADTRIHGPRAWLPLALDPAGRGVHETPIVFDVHPAARRYRGKSVTLIDERAQSQSEFLAQMLREAHERRHRQPRRNPLAARWTEARYHGASDDCRCTGRAGRGAGEGAGAPGKQMSSTRPSRVSQLGSVLPC
jgi:C-terminal processing protease CtpA/Prc